MMSPRNSKILPAKRVCFAVASQSIVSQRLVFFLKSQKAMTHYCLIPRHPAANRLMKRKKIDDRSHWRLYLQLIQ